jgi:hypothetical protein
MVALAALVTVSLPLAVGAGTSLDDFGTETARLATYENAAGETSFALSLSPQVDEHRELASDIVIYIDTSASQTGVFKADSITTLEAMLQKLSKDDRVKLVAIDVDPVELSDGFVSVDSESIKVAIEKLRQRVPLGTTDLGAMIEHAARQFESPQEKNRNAVYIGDGVSRDRFLHSPRFTTLIGRLAEQRISFSSFAIGPERDIETLSAIANNTGGNIFVDSDQPESMVLGASGLADTIHGIVFWPTKCDFTEDVAEVYPASIPPLRTDRDTIVVGTLHDRGDITVKMEGEINGQPATMNWPISAEPSNADFAFLPKLIELARKNRGMTLPTVGSSGLREMARVIVDGSNELAALGSQALATGNLKSARVLAEAAMSNDPNNTIAELLVKAAERAQQDENPFGTDEETTESQEAEELNSEDLKEVESAPQTQEGAGEELSPDSVAPAHEPLPNQQQPPERMPSVIEDQSLRLINPPSAQLDEFERLRQSTAESSQQIILTEEDRLKVLSQRLRARVQYELQKVRQLMIDSPGEALELAKDVLDIVVQTPEIDESTRSELRNSLESALMSARRRKLEYDEARALADRNAAAAAEIRLELDQYVDRENEIAALINRFDSLMEEGNHDAALEVTILAHEMAPDNPAVVAAYESASIATYYDLETQLIRLRRESFLASLYQVERSATPLSGVPPMIFPPADEWLRKRALRDKFQDVRLAGSENDEKILRQLNENADFEFDETPFLEVMEELRDKHQINVILDASARDDALTEDTPITFNVQGIRLKNALRLMLKEHNATYIVRDEVMLIISLDSASDPEFFVTNVYNVGDLVAPRFPIGGGGVGGGGGGFGGGGQGGGGFGGGGQGGGGFGGGFGGGGAGGGLFCVQDTETTAVPTAINSTTTPAKTTAAKPETVTLIPLPSEAESYQAWSDYFKSNHPSPARVRATIRKLMSDDQPETIVAMIFGAIQNDQSHSWMYEAMVLAMQIAGKPKSEIERALLSAVDMAGEVSDVMIVADYMARNGMEKRAIRLLQGIAAVDSNQPEPFVIGLRAAQQINDIEGIQWATVGIFNQAWPKHQDVVKQAKRAAEAVRMQLTKEGRTDELAEFNRRLDEALYRDCIIKVSWTGDADLDIYVMEPGGSICSRHYPRTTAGGILMGDSYSSSSDQSGELAEYYVLPRGFSGEYRLAVRRIWGDVTAGKVTVAIYQHFRTDKEVSQQKQIQLDDKGSMVVFTLNEGRRIKPLDEQQLQVVADEQFILQRHLLTQQLDEVYSSTAASDYYNSRENASEDGFGGAVAENNEEGLFIRYPRDAGYQPVITLLPEGAFLNVGHATTADRLYVMVSSFPFFSQITDVQTFNIFGSAETAGGGGLGGGGLGGGGLGGGGGGAGGGLF